MKKSIARALRRAADRLDGGPKFEMIITGKPISPAELGRRIGYPFGGYAKGGYIR